MALSDPRRKKAGDRRKRRQNTRIPVEDSVEEPASGKAATRISVEGAGNGDLEDRIEEALSTAEGHAQKAEEFKNGLIRLQAEFDNYRKRQAREFRRLCNEGKRTLISELLPVMDNFDRATALRDEGHGSDEILAGIFQTVTQMLALLRKEGLEEVQTGPGDPFDPNIHEAMVAEELEDATSDVVLEVFQKGYHLENDLLRPARVKVGRPAMPASDDKEELSDAPEEAEPETGEDDPPGGSSPSGEEQEELEDSPGGNDEAGDEPS